MSRTRYGLPYTGSKNFIAEDIVNALPEGERLVDLFGGGGAITHAALLLQKYNKFLYNDINPQITQLFVVYCDIPYDTSLKDVYGKFDHAAFFEWAKSQTYDVYFSSYLRDDYLEFADVIWSKEKYSLYCSMKNNHKNVECLYKIRK